MRSLRLIPLYLMFAGVLAGVAAMGQELAVPQRIVKPIDERRLVTIKGTRHPLANAANDRGAAPAGMQLERMHLFLQRSGSQETALRQAIADMHTPGTASYHKWLTPDEFGKKYGPSDEDIAKVTAWLTSHGFSVSKVNPGKQTIEFSGSAGQFKGAFHADIHKYAVNGETRYANANDPQIPEALAPVVRGFASLNNFRMKSAARVLGKATYDPKTDKAVPAWTWGTANGFNLVLAPGDYAVQYDLNPLYTAGLKGQGQSIAIIDYSNVNVALVNQFRSLFGLPVNPPQVIVDGVDPGIDGINDPFGPAFGTAVESYLDVEWAGAVAPDATIDLIVAADTALESGAFLSAERAVYSNVAPIISSSIYQYGCEQAAGTGNQFIESLWEQAAAQGITVLEAAGDSGSAGCDSDSSPYAENGLGVNNWASTPFNVAVGGTDFYYPDWATNQAAASIAADWNETPTQLPAVSLKGYIAEQPWNDSQFGLNAVNYYTALGTTAIAGGSGGASNCAFGTTETSSGWETCPAGAGYPKPNWQAGTGVPADGVRDIPDVSLFAADGLNFSFYPVCVDDGDCQTPTGSNIAQITGVGGTSAATPAFAGIIALVNQKYGGPQGQANYVLYPLKAQFPASFHDVTNGTNSVPCDLTSASPNCIAAPADNTIILDNTITEGQLGTGTTPDYNAAAGYNLATGLGTIDANQLVTNWNKVTFGATAITMTPSSTSFTHGTGITISGNVTGATPGGDVALMTDSTEQLQQGLGFFTLSSGAYTSGTNTVNYLPGGSYNIWTRYAGDTKNAASTSTPVAVTVAPEASGIYFALHNGSTVYTAASSPGTTVDYGTQLELSAQVAPTADVAGLQSCQTTTANCPTFGPPTGTVTFKDGSTTVNTALLNAEGDAEYNQPFSVGAHSVTANYNGDNSYNASTSAAPIAFTVVKDTPAINAYTTVTDSSNSDLINSTGQPTVLTVQVESGAQSNTGLPVGVAAPTGTVTLTSTLAGFSGTATLSPSTDPNNNAVASVATFTVPGGTTSGSYTVSVTYNGDSNYNTATTSPAIPITIENLNGEGNATTLAATLSGTTISPIASITITGTVTGQTGDGAPTGAIYVYSSGSTATAVSVTPGTTGVVSTFTATLNSETLFQGSNQITLQYLPDANSPNYLPSAMVLTNAIANPLSDFQLVPATTVVPVTPGSSNTVAVELSSTNGFSGAVSLTCSATSGVTCSIPGSSTLTAGGQVSATLTISAASATTSGTYNVLVTGKNASGTFVHTLGIQAIVAGPASTTPTFTLSNSGNITVTVGATTGNTSTITVTPSNAYTGTVALSCLLTNPPGSPVPPTCTMAPTSVDITSATALTSLLNIATVAGTTPGSYTFVVTGTDGTITQTTSVTVIVNAVAAPSFALSNSPAALTLTAGTNTGNTSTVSVTPSNGYTGTVMLTCAATGPAGATSPVTCALSPTSAGITSATAVTSTLTVSSTSTTTPGAYVVTVTGTDGTITQTATVNVTVNAAGTGTFALTSSPTTLTLAPGATTGNTTTISVTPSGGFTGTVALTCSVIGPSGATDPATCGVAPATASITGASAATNTLTVTTTAATTGKNEVRKLFWPSTGGAALAALLWFFVPKRRRNWLAMIAVLAVFAGLAGMGCGGGPGNTGGGGGGGGTTAGTYTVTVTGTSGTITQTTTVTVTVN
jgi:subtilase family serine protease